MPSMDYKPRMSVAGGRSVSGQQKKAREHDDGDAFMTLPDREIAGCISDIGIPFSVEDLRKPNPQQIQKVFEWFAELLTNTTREVVAPAMRAAAEHMCGDDADRIFTADTRELMGFFVATRKLLLECGIKDFTFSDLYRPTHPRLVKIFSYIINFIRFRESQTAAIDEHYNSSERVKNQIEQLYHANQEHQDRRDELRQRRAHVEAALQQKEQRSQDLKTRLLELKKAQERVTERLEAVKAEQSRWKCQLEAKTTHLLHTRHEACKLRPYTEQSPAHLEQSLRDLGASLGADRAELSRLDRRARALQTSRDSFAQLQAEIAALTRVQAEVAAELERAAEEARAAGRNREALGETSHRVREVERQEKLLRRQLHQWGERTGKLRADADARAAAAAARMEALRAAHRALTAERRERADEGDRRRARIEALEKKMRALKDHIDHEVRAAREEYMKMESHIRLYIAEMEQSM